MRSWIACVVFALASPLALAQEQAFANRSTELKDRGANEARTVGELREGAEVKVTQRAGGWARVESQAGSGWVRVFHLRFPAVPGRESSGSSAGGLLSSAASIIGGRPKAQESTIATTGIRGLSPEELKNASPDTQALRQMQGYRADRAAAERFAREGKLAETQVDDDGGRR